MSYIQQFFTSRDNNANAATFVGQEGRLWWDPITNQIYSSDGNTPGGIPLSGGGGNGSPGGANSQVQFNQNGNFGGSANLTFDRVSGALTAVSFVGDGSALTNITGANVTGTVADAASATVADSANSVAGANVSGTVANATYATSAGSATTATTAATVTTNAQPNITSIGTLTSVSSTGNISTTGNVSGNYFIGNGSLLTGIATSSYGNSNVAAYLASGTNSSNISTTGNITGSYILGNGSQLSAGLATYVTGNAQANITSVGTLTAANISGEMQLGNLSGSRFRILQDSGALYIQGGNGIPSSGASVIFAPWFNSLANATMVVDIPNRRVAIAKSSASVELDVAGAAAVSGNITGGNLLTGGIISATGNATVGNISATIGAFTTFTSAQGGNVTGTLIATSANAQFFNQTNPAGYSTVAGYLSVAGNITGSGNIIGNGYRLTSVNASNVSGTVAAASVAYSLPGGTAGALVVQNAPGATGFITIAAANTILTSDGSSPAWTLPSSIAVGTVTANAQPNITSVGTLTSVTVTANITGGNILTGGLISATGNITGGNILGGANVNATTHTGTTVSVTANVTGGNILTAGIMSSTGNAIHGNISVAGTISATGATNGTAFAVGNSAVSNVALGLFPTAGTPGEYAIRDYSTVTTNMYFDVGVGGTANGQFTFRTTNSYSTLATVNIYGITLTTNRPAFRVTGSGTTNNLTTTQNGTGALNGNNWAADYTQGSGLNSTTGVFTAPVAGLYQINVVGRNSGYAGGISQLAVVKNATGGTGAGGTVACMIEWAASSSMNHVGSGTVARLAVNDTLALKVLAGQINFDSNDNWSIAYLG